MERIANIERKTSESEVFVSVNLDGNCDGQINSSVPFFDHLLDAFCRHSGIDLTVKATGDTHIDVHHTVEDVAIALGQAIFNALGDKSGIMRFGDAKAPLDESLASSVVDLSGRPYLVHLGEPVGFEFHLIGGQFTGSLMRHIFESICYNAKICAHIELVRGRDPHHICEAEMKSFALAFKQAIAINTSKIGIIPSTKGVLNA